MSPSADPVSAPPALILSINRAMSMAGTLTLDNRPTKSICSSVNCGSVTFSGASVEISRGTVDGTGGSIAAMTGSSVFGAVSILSEGAFWVDDLSIKAAGMGILRLSRKDSRSGTMVCVGSRLGSRVFVVVV